MGAWYEAEGRRVRIIFSEDECYLELCGISVIDAYPIPRELVTALSCALETAYLDGKKLCEKRNQDEVRIGGLR